MRSSNIIKICKVESLNFAKYCLSRGADYLGVHVIDFKLDDSKRELCRYVAARNGKAVVLTKEVDLNKLKQLVEFYEPWAIQLHYHIGEEDRREAEEFLGIPVIPVFTDDTAIDSVKSLLSNVPFAIYDTSFIGGTGVVHRRELLDMLTAKERSKILLAGGVNPDVINELRDCDLAGFDVQSYCRENSRHHYGRAEKILRLLKGPISKRLSVSLTDIVSIDTIPLYHESECLEYQVDFSEGSLYGHFIVDSQKIEDIVRRLDAPITLHIFEADVVRFQSVIDKFNSIASNNIVRINIQFSPRLRLDRIDTYDALFCASLYYQDIETYLQSYPELHECISLILPSDIPRKERVLEESRQQVTRLSTKEIWFDRRVDLETVELVQRYSRDANFIAGDYIINRWSNETVIAERVLNG